MNLTSKPFSKGRLILFILPALLAFREAGAQEILQLLEKDQVKVRKLERKGDRYFKDREKGKGSGYKLYMRQLYWAKRNADEKGRVISDEQVLDECENFQKNWNQSARSTAARTIQRSSGWQELGPFKWSRTTSWNPGLGRIVSIAVEPNQQRIIYAGSPGGGIWKSTNAGQSWIPVGDDLINMTIWSIAIDPNNSNVVYMGNSAGQIMKSTNAGSSWSEIARLSGTPRRILIHPNGSTIFVGTTRYLYRSTNSGNSFSRVLSSKAEDVEFRPGNTNVVYACGDNFYRSTNGGVSFSRITSGITRSERMKMAVTPANPNVVYLVQKSGSSFGRLYRSTNGGASFTVRADNGSTNQVYFTQAHRDMAIAVSNTNSNEVHLAGMNYSRSTNGGSTFSTLAAWNQPGDRSYIHADVEFMQYVNGVIYYGTDGGIYRSTNQGNDCEDLTQKGLAVRQYYRIGGSATDPNMIIGGAQDNGTNIMNGSSRQFKEWLGADGMECFINRENKNIIYGTVQFGSLYKSTNGGNSIGNISKPGNFSGNWVTPFMQDPIRSNTIYVGYSNVYRSTTGGTSGSWRNLTSSINLGGNLDEMAIAPSNNNYIYLARGSKVWRTKNGQSSSPSWVEVSGFSGDVNFITVDPNNPERVAIATTGSRVYVSTNAGSSWSNIRGNLPNISAQCVVYDDTQRNGLYVGMQSGVYYTNDVLSQWVPFMENLPNVQTSELEIHYPSRKIRLATYGRGIWESDLYDGNTSDGVSAPSNLLAQVEEKDVQLSWKDNASDETSFSLERSNGGAYQVIATLQANRTSYIDTNLEEGTYAYRIRARRNSDFSNYSNAATATVEGEVTPPDVADDCIGCRVYATNSEETESADNGKENAADGDEDTFWHTNWYDDETETHPHYIAIDLGRERDLVGFSYLARQTERTTGMVKDYELRGWNGSQWVQLSVGQLQKSRLKQSVDFNKFRTRYVNFRALSEVDGKRWATVAEFTARYLPDDNENQNARATQEEVPGATPPEVNLDELEGLKIFPIPFANELTIRGINFKKSVRSIKFIGVDGREFKIRFKTTNDGAVFDTSKLLKGMYVLHLEEAEQTRTLRVFKQ